MMGKIIDGRAVAAEACLGIKARVQAIAEKGVTPKLAVVLVGDNPASRAYVGMKEKKAAELGIATAGYKLSAEISEDELIALVKELNGDASIHGILVQLPLPKHISEERVLMNISPAKDVDGLHPVNAGMLMTGRKGFVPCTPKGCVKLVESTGVDIAGKNCVVLGRSNIVGKPAAILMLAKNATVTMCHSRTENLGDVTRGADILISAVGVPNLITADMIKPGAVVIDVAQCRVNDAWRGDVDFEGALEVAGHITPVPGGVGPMTIAMLMENTVEAAEKTLD
ncbi:MAG: tetrahydrofolate dehydrogenase/cyclohydrolase catalytic domain-containing protein [Clostridia bacterium]|nr:tetrahydrofolate dehydrogenase/cyclohydrolase catalytic domain-containing protein [Clostridia bacterium]